MAFEFLTKVFGSKNERELNRIRPYVDKINGLENNMKALSDAALLAKTAEFKTRLDRYASHHKIDLKTCEKKDINPALWEILPEAFAVCRESSRRVLEMRHFDVQLIGGMVLHDGKIAEMKTGEGKTLVATLAVYLNALAGRGVHLVTVNDYLAKRDSEWMGRLYRSLGLSTGVVLSGSYDDVAKQKAYACDITYGQNNEFGFDYLRDNMKFRLSRYVQRELFFAIVDEVDSILIDEARTPLIISGPSEDSTDKYATVNRIIPQLRREVDFTIDEKARSAMLTEDGVAKAERLLNVDNLYDPANIEFLHHVNQALRAHMIYKRDVDYVVQEGECLIVDEHTGRLMEGRRWSDGLHQAIEAKEGVKIQNENQTLATITFQNYFRMYKKLGGMTGTADTEAPEFAKIYNLDVVVVPTHRKNVRVDQQDTIYLSEKEKFEAILKDIEECAKKKQPVLVGTVSVEKSEVLYKWLKRKNIPGNVLNAKYHAQEAEIVAQAGRLGQVTISTNMAGRGTDILLGGNPEFLARKELGPAPSINDFETEQALDEATKAYDAKVHELMPKYKELCKKEHDEVVAAGGLHIIGTERHESRRIDNQLRGRAGRQGDPGSSRFYISLEDDLIRVFGGDRMKTLMQRFGMKEGEVIEHPWVTKSIENAQKRVEGHNFDIRKNLIEYDDVMNLQRKAIYGLRREVLGGEDAMMREKILDLIEDGIISTVQAACPEKEAVDKWDLDALQKGIKDLFAVDFNPRALSVITRESLEDAAFTAVELDYKRREAQESEGERRKAERYEYLRLIDQYWKEHLQQVDHLKEGINLRGYAQKDPKQEYKKEAYNLFVDMMARMSNDILFNIFHMRVIGEAEYMALMEAERQKQKMVEQHASAQSMAAGPAPEAEPANAGQQPQRMLQQPQTEPVKVETFRREKPKVGRNDPCYCGSGKKYKACHLPEDEAAEKRA
jgi:preprotein translocase subunit SecA